MDSTISDQKRLQVIAKLNVTNKFGKQILWQTTIQIIAVLDQTSIQPEMNSAKHDQTWQKDRDKYGKAITMANNKIIDFFPYPCIYSAKDGLQYL